MAHIILKDICKEYGENENKICALNNVSLEILDKEFVVILGQSGAGKSTLLNILGGMDSPTSGEYLVDGEVINKYNDKELCVFRRDSVGFVFQFYNLIPNISALENVMLCEGLKKNSLNSKDVLEMVGLKDRASNFPYALSGGEQQRVSIARALVKKPKLLLCDEPTGALDSKTGKNIIKLLYDIAHNQNQSVVIVTHNSNLALIADRVIKISDGKIISNEINNDPKGIDDITW